MEFGASVADDEKLVVLLCEEAVVGGGERG